MLVWSAAVAALAAAPRQAFRQGARGTVAGGRACLAAMSAAGFVDQTIEVGGQQAKVRRFVEADVGMTFKKDSLNDKLFAQPWPPEWPFPPRAFARQDESDDDDFYATPRFVYHIDEGGSALAAPPARLEKPTELFCVQCAQELASRRLRSACQFSRAHRVRAAFPLVSGAVRALTNYYKDNIPPGSAILDICSSWVSHYPENFPSTMPRIAGSGMNLFELQANSQLSELTVGDLNKRPALEFADASFDVVTCVVSVDYLNDPLSVFREVRRVLKPGGKFILSQSNRCFPTKAISMWLGMDDLQHCLVIAAYFHYVTGFAPAQAYDVSPTGPRTNDPLFIVEATKL